MPVLVTIEGIDQAIASLALTPETQKSKLIVAIRGRLADQEALVAATIIPVEELIEEIWGEGDADAIKSRRKSFSSLKSALNKSFKELDAQGLNPEGVIIGRNNVFEASEDHKSALLEQLGIGSQADGDRMANMVAAFKKVYPDAAQDQGMEELKGLFQGLEQAQTLIAGLREELREKDSQIVGLKETINAQTQSGGGESIESGSEVESEVGAGGDSDLLGSDADFVEEEVEIVEVDESELAESGSEGESEAGAGGDSDLLGSDADFVEEEVEIVEVDESELAEYGSEGESETGAGGDSDLLGSDTDFAEEEVEIVEVDKSELAESGSEGESEAGAGGDSDLLGSDTDFVEEEVEIVEVDESELAESGSEGESEAGAGGDSDLLGSDADFAEEEVEIVEVDESELAESGSEGESETGAGGDSDLLGSDTDFVEEEVEIVEVDESELAESGSEGESETGAGGDSDLLGSDTDFAEEEVEIVEVDESELAAAGSEGESETGAGGDSDLLGSDADFVEEEVEIVEVDESDLMEGGSLEADGQNSPGPPQNTLLEVLSKYLDPEQALDQRDILSESEEGLVSQLLERFTPKFIKIPEGVYLFGCSNPGFQEHSHQEVRVKSFYLGQYPVTNDLFELFVRETGYETDAEKAGFGLVFEGAWQSRKDPDTGLSSFSIRHVSAANQISGANWRHPAGPGSSLENRHNHPVVQVSQRDAFAFASWAGKRLPTEEEWESAARGNDGRLFPWGNDWESDRANLGVSCLGETTPVERYRDKGKSPFGIIDMLGNAYEWTATRDQLATMGIRFILKGGCWNSRGIISVCHRSIQAETWANTIGFRLAVSG